MIIDQFSSARHGVPHDQRLKQRWNFKDYYDVNKPCFFWGIIGEEHKINAHKGLKVVAGITPLDCTYAKRLVNSDNLYFWDDVHLDAGPEYKRKNVRPEIKDYSMFQPNLLGDKIYAYMRDPHEFKLSTLQRIQKRINYEFIFTNLPNYEVQYYIPIEKMKELYYDKCFLNVNLSGRVGFTTIIELAHMGRKTICNTPYTYFNSLISFKDEDDIVRIINEESRKIGTIQPAMNCHTTGEEWIRIDFWTGK
jgi:hypothetical protein